MIELNYWISDAQSNLVSVLALDIISKEPTYGYNIKKMIEKCFDLDFPNFELKISSLYTLLRRLEDLKLIISYKDENLGVNKREKNRTFYQITDNGKITLEVAWKEWDNIMRAYTRIRKIHD